MQKRIKEILKEVAEEEGLAIQVIEAIFNSQFKEGKSQLSKGNPEDTSSFVNVRFPFLGSISTTEAKINRIKKVFDERKQNG